MKVLNDRKYEKKPKFCKKNKFWKMNIRGAFNLSNMIMNVVCREIGKY